MTLYELSVNIEIYCKILDDIVIIPLDSVMEFSIIKELPLSKEKYEERKKDIASYINQQLDKVNDVEVLSIALFIFRTVIKNKMYNDNFEDWTIRFKICNYLFFETCKYLKNRKTKIYFSCNEYLVIKNMFLVGYTLFRNQIAFNAQFYEGNNDSMDEFFECIEKISNRKGDLHSYSIKNKDLKAYLNRKNISIDEIRKHVISKYATQFISKAELDIDDEWTRMKSQNTLISTQDNILMISIPDFDKCNSRLKNFISSFEAERCQFPLDSENELIFAYRTEKYLYISKKILNDTQMMIEDFCAWGQYENITKYFFGMSVDQNALRNYNYLMTYKIVDVLHTYGYIMPMENLGKISIPRIEISNYVVDKKLKNELGDIDIIFYSIPTKTLYLVEYKNYQMLVSRGGDLSSEISKVKREMTPQRVNKRWKYFCENIEYCIKTLFKTNHEIYSVKSIILTTKPCYYFFLNKSDEYIYLEWAEFENRVMRREL